MTDKATWEGWIGKTMDPKDAIEKGRFGFFDIFINTQKGKKHIEWDAQNWPPKKVRITVEVVE